MTKGSLLISIFTLIKLLCSKHAHCKQIKILINDNTFYCEMDWHGGWVLKMVVRLRGSEGIGKIEDASAVATPLGKVPLGGWCWRQRYTNVWNKTSDGCTIAWHQWRLTKDWHSAILRCSTWKTMWWCDEIKDVHIGLCVWKCLPEAHSSPHSHHQWYASPLLPVFYNYFNNDGVSNIYAN